MRRFDLPRRLEGRLACMLIRRVTSNLVRLLDDSWCVPMGDWG